MDKSRPCPKNQNLRCDDSKCVCEIGYIFNRNDECEDVNECITGTSVSQNSNNTGEGCETDKCVNFVGIFLKCSKFFKVFRVSKKALRKSFKMSFSSVSDNKLI